MFVLKSKYKKLEKVNEGLVKDMADIVAESKRMGALYLSMSKENVLLESQILKLRKKFISFPDVNILRAMLVARGVTKKTILKKLNELLPV